MIIDTHCHIDLYPNPSQIALAAERAKILTVLVTNLPSAFDRAYPHVQEYKHVRLALGLHPLVAEQHLAEHRRFQELIDKTSYIGEIGLDFSPEANSTKKLQIDSFRFVLESLGDKPKFITLHSRQAESTVLDILEEYKRVPVVFHWYTGSLESLDRAIAQGHYFSINLAMVKSEKGKKIIARIPPERLLTESDGPFIKIGTRSAVPFDVPIIIDYLSFSMKTTNKTIEEKIKKNFLELLKPIKNQVNI